MSTDQRDRLHALDAVRGFALIAGVAFHACLSFLPGPQMWIVMDSQRSITLSVLFFTLHMFRMAVFFLIAGFMARLSLHRRGTWGFVGDRARRIALPLIVGWPILFASILAVSIWAAVKTLGPKVAAAAPPPPWPTLPNFPLTHLWFLYVLLLFYGAALVLRGLVVAIDRKGALRRGMDAVLARLLTVAPLLMAAPLALALIAQPVWMAWFGIATPDSSLIPNTPALVGYGMAFGLGWMLHRQTGLLDAIRRRWPLNLGLAIACTAGCLCLIGLKPMVMPAAHDTRTMAFAGLYALGVFAWTFGLIGLALRFASNHSPARRYIADASYWIYLLHLPVVMALQTLVSDQAWPWPAKYAAVVLGALALLFASYQLLVRYSFVGAVLNGRRTRRLAKPVAFSQPRTAGETP